MSWRVFLVIVLSFLFLSLLPNSKAQAQSLTVLYSFPEVSWTEPYGGTPAGGVIRDGKGNLYGTTVAGGAEFSGTVFKISPSGVESVQYSFTGQTDGSSVNAGLARDGANNLYGAAPFGGSPSCNPLGQPGCGTAFKLAANGSESTLHTFGVSSGDGQVPQGGVIRDSSGNLYGVTELGGLTNNGTVYEITASGVESVLYSFKGGTDGAIPNSTLVRDAQGNLYGTTSAGGKNCFSGCGTVFKISPNGTETQLYAFTGAPDGWLPQGALARDNAGNLYGTTTNGGLWGNGTLFKIDPQGEETILHSFGSLYSDGSSPKSGVIRACAGNLGSVISLGSECDCAVELYGTAPMGGDYGWGTIFEYDSTGAFSTLYSFTGGVDGKYPFGTLALDSSGNLYGTAESGGTSQWGTVFKLTP